MLAFAVAVILSLTLGTVATAQTPTPTACATFPPPALTFQLSVEPAHPVVGDSVTLSFDVSGRGGLPAYTLSGADPEGLFPAVNRCSVSSRSCERNGLTR